MSLCGDIGSGSFGTGGNEGAPEEADCEIEHSVPVSSIDANFDHHTVASSVTSGFRDAELYAPNIYPSAWSVQNLEEAAVPDMDKTPPSRMVAMPSFPEESSVDTGKTSLTEMEDKILKLQVKKEAEKAASLGMHSKKDLGNEKMAQAKDADQLCYKIRINANNFMDNPEYGMGDKDRNPQSLPAAPKEALNTEQDALGNPRDEPRNVGQISEQTTKENNEERDPFNVVESSQPLPANVPANPQASPGAYAVQAVRFNPPTHPSATQAANNRLQRNPQTDEEEPPQNHDGLAEAQPVTDEHPDTPHAVPMFNSGDSRKTVNRFPVGKIVLLVAVGILLILGAVVGSLCGSGYCSVEEVASLPTNNSSETTTYHRDEVDVTNIEWEIKYVLGKDYFDTGEDFVREVRQKTLHWLLFEDPLQLNHTDTSTDTSRLLQRFLLALFYFHTTRYSPWESCNIPEKDGPMLCDYSDNYPLEVVSPIWGNSWLSDSHECLWAGISCSSLEEGRAITEIILTWNNLNGQIPWELSKLTSLIYLDLHRNQISGTVPSWMGSLLAIRLEANNLNGTIPSDLFSVRELTNKEDRLTPSTVNLIDNSLTGIIPSEIGLSAREIVYLSGNMLDGSIPPELFDASNLGLLDIGNNREIKGSIPTEIGRATALGEFVAEGTSLSGTIPSEIGLLTGLNSLSLSNTNLGGTLPEEIFHGLSSLLFMDISGCQFSGTISESVGLLATLVKFHIASNNFSGSLPGQLGALSDLTDIALNGNNFTDRAVPHAWCSLRKPSGIFDWIMVADCTPDPTTGVPAMTCPDTCCTSCCDPKTDVCQPL